MRKDYTNDPILITGAARSGTSMVAACIHLCGAWKGNTVGPSRYNQKGMFENNAIRQGIIKPILRKMGADPLGQYPLPETEQTLIPQNFKDDILDTIKLQGWKENLPWMYKCVKLSLIWPVWKYTFPRSKWIIVRRKEEDIVYSCMHTGFMRAFSRKETLREINCKTEEEGWNWWVEFYKKKFVEIINNGVNTKVVWPEKMVHGDYSEIKDAIEWLGLEWDGPAVMDFIEPKLWKSRQK